MNKEQIDKLHQLECKLYDAKTRRNWMEDWSNTLYAEDERSVGNCKFHLKIENNQGKCVLSREISREEVEMEFNARLKEINDSIESIEKEIAGL